MCAEIFEQIASCAFGLSLRKAMQHQEPRQLMRALQASTTHYAEFGGKDRRRVFVGQ